MAKLSTILVIVSLIQVSLQNTENNEIDENPFVEAAQNLFKGNGGFDVGSILTNLVQGQGANGGGALDIIQGLGSLLGQPGGAGGVPDLSALGGILSMLNQPGKQAKHADPENFDFGSLLSFASNFISQDGNADMMSYLPQVADMVSAFTGPEAGHIADSHADHSWYMPPMLEKIHVVIDQFMNSKFGKDTLTKLGAENFIKIFYDGKGRFDGTKMNELLENHSFRRHWIHLVTKRITEFLSQMSDPAVQKRYLTTTQFFLNSYLKGMRFPKSVMFDPAKPTESLVRLANYIPKKYFDMKVDLSPFVRPTLDYFRDLVKLAERNGFLGKSLDSGEITHRLTDTLNMEIIEPLSRVNRALRFAKKVPKCTRYVLCLANRHENLEHLSLPGVKKGLSYGATIFASWLVSSSSKTPFITLYNSALADNCKPFYHDVCHDFHIEEEKVTTEYVHGEL